MIGGVLNSQTEALECLNTQEDRNGQQMAMKANNLEEPTTCAEFFTI